MQVRKVEFSAVKNYEIDTAPTTQQAETQRRNSNNNNCFYQKKYL